VVITLNHLDLLDNLLVIPKQYSDPSSVHFNATQEWFFLEAKGIFYEDLDLQVVRGQGKSIKDPLELMSSRDSTL
jgi:hypothetical protein